MAGMSHRCREITTALDAAGNTNVAIRKDFHKRNQSCRPLSKPILCDPTRKNSLSPVVKPLSFTPKTFYYDMLKRIGELFPRPSKATRSYLHSEADTQQALQKVGWKIR
ncbi:magnesium protoporphyrin IX methyltransferase, chloroplastic [Tanacetum coccineum]